MNHRNVATAGIDAVVVDTADIIAAFERNRDEDANGRHHVLRVTPPFEGDVRAEPHESDGEVATPTPDSSVLDLSPELFVENYRGDDPERTTVRIPTRDGSRRAARTDHGDEVDEETVAAYHEREMAVWRDCVRDSLVETVRIAVDPEEGTETWVDVRYR